MNVLFAARLTYHRRNLYSLHAKQADEFTHQAQKLLDAVAEAPIVQDMLAVTDDSFEISVKRIQAEVPANPADFDDPSQVTKDFLQFTLKSPPGYGSSVFPLVEDKLADIEAVNILLENLLDNLYIRQVLHGSDGKLTQATGNALNLFDWKDRIQFLKKMRAAKP